jgi:hypothetical protein
LQAVKNYISGESVNKAHLPATVWKNYIGKR